APQCTSSNAVPLPAFQPERGGRTRQPLKSPQFSPAERRGSTFAEFLSCRLTRSGASNSTHLSAPPQKGPYPCLGRAATRASTVTVCPVVTTGRGSNSTSFTPKRVEFTAEGAWF